MFNILIVEDDPIQQNMLETTIHSQYPSWNICTANTYENAMEKLLISLKTGDYFSLFLLDIQLSETEGDRGGFILATEIRKREPYYMTPLLFLTAISDDNYFALSHYHCYNYIAKPYSQDAILFQLQQMLLTGYLKEISLQIMDVDHIYHTIPLATIESIQSDKHLLTFQLKHGTLKTRAYSLSGIEKKLGKPFMRCHKTAVVNMEYITSFDKKTQSLVVANRHIPVGRKYISDIEATMQMYKNH